MKKLLPAMLTLLGAYTVSAQVGIGTSNPSPSAQLQIVSQDRGVLIPQVQLTSTTDTTTITAGNVQSLLVYNVSTSADIKPGYYYWYVNKWYRLINDADLAAGGPNGSSPIIDNGDGTYTYVNPDGTTTTIDVPGHQTLTFLVYDPASKTLTYTAENGQNTVIDINAMVKNSETVTTLVDNGNGTMTYTNEAGVQTVITKAQGVQGAQGADGLSAYQIWLNAGNTGTEAQFLASLKGADGAAGTNGADGLSAYQIWLNAGNTGTEAQFLASLKGADGAAGTNGTNGADGLSAYQIWLNAGNTGTEAQFLASLKGADGAAGTNGTDGKGITTTVNNGDGTFTINYTDGTSTTIDFKNIETTTNIVNNGDGTYTYTNEDGIQTVIDVRANAVPFDNTASGLAATTVQGAIDALAAANNTTNTQLSNITLVEENDGKVTLVKADGTKVKVDKGNVTDNGDGTYTFSNGNGNNVTINSNNLVITENAGVYIFADAAGNVLGSINTNASALGYNNTASGLTATTVQGAIDEVNNNINTQINTVALTDNGNGTVSLIGANGVNLGTVSKADLAYNVATGKYTFTNNDGSDVTLGGEDLTAGDNSVEVAGGTHALLAPANVKVKDGGITTAKLADDAVTSVKIKDGEVKNADLADDAVSTDKILNGTILGEDIANETITNNKLDAGSAAAGTVATSNGDGSVSYLPVSTANLAGKEDLTAADGAAATIEVIGGTDAVLAATSLRVKAESITSAQIKDGEVKTADIAGGAVTNDKLDAGAAAVGTVATSNGDGTVSYLPVSTANLANKGTLSSPVNETPVSILVTDGTDALLKNAQISVADGGITTAKLANDAVTNAKLADNAVQSENIKDGEVKNADLANDAVSSNKILNGTILGEDVATKTITADKLSAVGATEGYVATVGANGVVTYEAPTADATAITGGKALTSTDLSVSADGGTALLKDVTIDINAGAVTEVKLGTGAVTTTKLGADAVTNDKLADNAVQTENITDNAVTSDKINADVAGAGLVKNTSNGKLDIATNGVTSDMINADVAGDGLVKNTTTGKLDVVAGAVTGGKALTSTDLSVSTDGDTALLKDVTIDINAGAVTEVKLGTGAVTTTKLGADAVTNDKLADNAVQTENIVNGTILGEDVATKTITADKLSAVGATEGYVATVGANGVVTYEAPTADATAITGGKALTSTDLSVSADGGTALLKDVTIDINAGAVTEVKLGTGAVTTTKLGADAVTNDKLADNAVQTENITDNAVTTAKINNGAVTTDKMNSGSALDGKVATADGNGGVVFGDLPASSVQGEDLTAGDTSVAVVGGLGATLKPVTVAVAENGITSDKINSNVAGQGLVKNTTTGQLDIADNGVTTVKINNGAVTSDKIDSSVAGEGLVKNTSNGKLDIAADGVTAAMINPNVAGAGLSQNASGALEVNTAAIATGDITGGTEITVADGDNSVFKDVTLGIANNAITNDKMADNAIGSTEIINGSVLGEDVATKTITADKLSAVGATEGYVATVGANGVVTYEAPTADVAAITGGKALTSTDLSVSTNGATALLKDVTIDINAGAVTEVKLGTGAVTTTKLGADAVTNDKLADNAVQTENITDNAVTTAKINNGAVTTDKMNSGLAANGKVATADGNGGVVFGNLPSSSVTGQNMTAADGSVAILGGIGATLVPVTVAVAVDGITNDKIADNAVQTENIATGAVTTAKIADNAVTTGKIENGTILGEDVATKTITADKLSAVGATEGYVATVGANGVVTYEAVTTASVTGGKALTSTDLSVSTNGATALLKDVTININDGAVTEVKLGTGAVTETKLGTGAVTTTKIADNAVTSDKINANVAGAGLVKNTTTGKLDIANNGVTSNMINADVAGDGLVKNTTTGKLDVVAGAVTGGKALLSNDLDVTSPEGATALLKEVTVNIKNDAITSAKIANGTIQTVDIASTGNDKVLTTAANGTVTWADKTELAIEPWNNQNTSNKATANSSNIYQNGSIGIGNFAAENVSEKLDVKDGNVKIREINTVAGAPTDKVVVADSNGVLKTVSAMPGIRKETASYSAVIADETILADATGGDMTITLPTTPVMGKKYNIKKVDTSDNKVTISGNGKTIDGLGSISGALPHQGWVLQYDGTDWYIINRI